MEKRGISKNLILLFLIIAIAIVLVVIVFGIIKENRELLGVDIPDLEISEVLIINGSAVNVVIKKNAEDRDFDGVLLTAYDKDDSEKRKIYDQYGHEGMQGGADYQQYSNLNDIFANFGENRHITNCANNIPTD